MKHLFNTWQKHQKTCLVLAIILLLAQCLFLYGNTARDDAFFTYWPAYSLAEHGSILNYNGEHVEQSSTLFYTVLLAATKTLLPFFALPTLSWALSLLSGVLTLWVFAATLQDRKAHAAATVLLASASPVIFWSSSGMETLSATFLFTAILFLCTTEKSIKKHYTLLALCCTAAVLNRPEAFIVLLCFVVAMWPLQCLLRWSFKAIHHRVWFTALLSTALSAALVSAWRHYYFHAWLPQPVTAKHNDNIFTNLLNGANYLAHGGNSFITLAIMLAGLSCGLLAFLFWKHRHRTQIISGCVLAITQIAFIMATGGDWMDAARFLLPVLPALLLSVVLFFAPWPRILLLLTLPAIAFALHDSWQFAQQQSTGFAIHERQAAIRQYIPASVITSNPYSAAERQSKDALRDIPQLERLNTLIRQLNNHPQKLNIASIQMGFIPYHLAINFPEKLHFLDLRALSTRELTDCHVLKPLSHTSNGLIISYEQFFALLPVLNRQCKIQKPDILYDLGYNMRKQTLEDNGYIVTYLEQRTIRGSFSKRAIGSELFVAVRKELAAQYRIADIHGQIPVIAPPATVNHPNIVFVIADDVSYDKFGFMGNKAAKTPTLDQLAQQGTVFTTAYVPTAFCRPSLATLLTGQWPHQTRLYTNRGIPVLPAGSSTLATHLQQSGYITFSGGKFWEDEPDLRGFDYFDPNKDDFARKNQDVLWRFLDSFAGKQPMFIFWAPLLPHRPHNAPQKFMDAIDESKLDLKGIPLDQQEHFKEAEKRLLAMTMWFDDEFNKLFQQLKTRNQLENTVFVFLADNGFSNRGISKSAPYELGLRTPIIFYWPGHFPVQLIDAGVDTVNIFKTILDIANVPALSIPLPGHSLLPVITQKTPPIAEKLFGADYPAFSLKTDPLPRPERDIFALHVRDGDWKYIFFLRDVREQDNLDLTIQKGVMPFPERKAGDEELFYLPDDPYERNNLAGTENHSARIQQYRREVLQWWFSTGGQPLDAALSCASATSVLCHKLADVPYQDLMRTTKQSH